MVFFPKKFTNTRKLSTAGVLIRKLTGFSGSGEVVTEVEGISFPLEREEAVET
jgi:hypothetical protein